MFELLLAAGIGVFSLALRSFQQPWVRRLGGIGLLVTSFLVGYFLTGRVEAGFAAVAIWFLLPWLEILTRIRHLRLPLDKHLHQQAPPGRNRFPELNEVTEEIEALGFEHVADNGWDWDGFKQFYRTFYDPKSRTQAALCLSEQGPVAFSYLALSSRSRDGKTWRTWNYPFSYTMRLAPELCMNRILEAGSIGELVEEHRDFLERHRIETGEILDEAPDEIPEQMEREVRRQIDHNLDCGLIRLSGNGTFRYSWRGLFFLWRQFVKDMVKFG